METRVGGPCSLSGRDPHLQLGAPRMPECHPPGPTADPNSHLRPPSPTRAMPKLRSVSQSLSYPEPAHVSGGRNPRVLGSPVCSPSFSCLPHTAISKLQGPPAKCTFQPPPLFSVKTTPDHLVPYYSNVFIAADIFNQ